MTCARPQPSMMAFRANDGGSHWVEGVQLLAVCIIPGIALYFLPVPHTG